MKFLSLTLFTLSSLASFAISATVLPRIVPSGADTPLFYLVSSSADASPNLLPLRLSGGTGNFASLTGSEPIGKFYFYQGRLTALDPAGTSNTYKPLISGVPTASGCSSYGPLGFVQGSTTDKCAKFDTFQIQSDTENSQLGAALVFNYDGGFYVCGPTLDVWYKAQPEDGPTDCTPIQLYTVPVVV